MHAARASGQPEVVFYVRPGCHFCCEARETLRRHGLVVQEIDITTDPALARRFTACVPVVVMDGRIRFRGRVNGPLLRRLLGRCGTDAGPGLPEAGRELL